MAYTNWHAMISLLISNFVMSFKNDFSQVMYNHYQSELKQIKSRSTIVSLTIHDCIA